MCDGFCAAVPKDVCALLVFSVTVHVVGLFSVQTFLGQNFSPLAEV